MHVKLTILPVIFGLKRKEYLFIMTVLFHNITFDDTYDKIYMSE
jgi:hypothetical protein